MDEEIHTQQAGNMAKYKNKGKLEKNGMEQLEA